MSATQMSPPPATWPGHLELPWSNGEIVENAGETPQNTVLTESITPLLKELHPDDRFFIGCDVGIYFKYTDPPLDGCRAPDWFYVPNVGKWAPDGELRRSYVMWKEKQAPYLVIENVSGNGEKEHDATPEEGKFWVYEQALKVQYYAIYDGFRRTLECYRLKGGRYVRMKADKDGRYPIERLKVSLGLWRGEVQGLLWTWVRFFDAAGQPLPSDKERGEMETKRADAEKQRADESQKRSKAEMKRAEAAELENARLRELLKKAGVDPQ